MTGGEQRIELLRIEGRAPSTSTNTSSERSVAAAGNGGWTAATTKPAVAILDNRTGRSLRPFDRRLELAEPGVAEVPPVVNLPRRRRIVEVLGEEGPAANGWHVARKLPSIHPRPSSL